MEKKLVIQSQKPPIALGDTIVYSQKTAWSSSTYRQLRLSIMRQRHHFPYDCKNTLPVLIFLCGGGFEKVDSNVWMPELYFFAEHGYAVISVEYSVTNYTKPLERVQDVKQAIRFVRKHASDFLIDPDRIAIMGESAGGYLTSMVGITDGCEEFEVGDFLEESSSVNAAIPWYPPIDVQALAQTELRLAHVAGLPKVLDYVKPTPPPFLIFHGMEDEQIPYSHSQRLHKALLEAGGEADLYLIEGANHGDIHFTQPEIKERILSFLNKHLSAE